MRKEETVDYNVKITWHAIARMYNQKGLPFDITASTGFVLLNIDTENGAPATKIAPLLGLEARSLTRMLKTLEEKGLIYKQQDPHDRRSVRIYLTDLGREKRELSRKVVKEFNLKVRENIAPEKLEVFFDVINDIHKILDNQNLFNDLENEITTLHTHEQSH